MITLVTGGQRSGKSKFAENLLIDKDRVAYIATAKVDGKEMEERVKLHRLSRPSSWRTIEAYRDFTDLLGQEDYYLLECLGTMTSNIMFDYSKDLEYIDVDLAKKIEDEVYGQVEKLINQIKKADKNLVVVTNEVGFSLTSISNIGRVYTDVLGRINQRVAKLCDHAYLVVAGMELKLK